MLFLLPLLPRETERTKSFARKRIAAAAIDYTRADWPAGGGDDEVSIRNRARGRVESERGEREREGTRDEIAALAVNINGMLGGTVGWVYSGLWRANGLT